jgi:ABC-type bacteriocin/lantibiotic exporter with double-glycine peptidase domain
VSYVPQQIYLFDDTIKNNITLDEENKNFDKIRFFECLQIAELTEFVNKLPKKEDTFIGEIGSNLSGGQKQRIGIARALYKKSEIMIFDEATNALDKETEKKVLRNLEQKLNRTFIMIHHQDIPENLINKTFEIKDKKVKVQ